MNNCLYHYGVKGMRWGVRRYQNEDGSYNAAGVSRYNKFRREGGAPKSTNHNGSIKKALAVAGTAAALGGTALAYRKSPAFRKAALSAYNNGRYRATQVRNATRAIKRLPGMRQISRVNRVINKPYNIAKQVVGRTPGGRLAVKGYVAAVGLSDANTIYNFVKSHKKDGVTSSDFKELGLDLLTPVPNNLPGINKSNDTKKTTNTKKKNTKG